MVKPTHHARGALRVSTMALIFSVIEAKVWPGPRIGVGPGRSAVAPCAGSCSMPSSSRPALELDKRRVGVLEGPQVRRPGPRVEVLEQAVVDWLALQPGHLAAALGKVAEDDGPGRAGRLAGGQH